MSAYQPLLVVVLCLVPLCVAAALANQPVNRARVERFAQRHQLVITVGNGQRVINYLATTRRLRATGLAAGLAANIAWLLPHRRIGVDIVFLLPGWFAGALVAEWRVAQLTAGRSAAVLVPRSAERYLPASARWAPPAAAAACAALAVLLLAAPAGRTHRVRVASLLVAALTVTTLVYAVRRRVLGRAQPLAPPDVLHADNAIRSRSLHVLAGTGTALLLYCALGLAAPLAVAVPDLAGLVTAVELVGGFAAPLLGWRIATAPWPTPSPLGPSPVP